MYKLIPSCGTQLQYLPQRLNVRQVRMLPILFWLYRVLQLLVGQRQYRASLLLLLFLQTPCLLAVAGIQQPKIQEGRPERSTQEVNVRVQALPDSLPGRSEEHTSELHSLMSISYAVFGWKEKI